MRVFSTIIFYRWIDFENLSNGIKFFHCPIQEKGIVMFSHYTKTSFDLKQLIHTHF